LKKIDIFEGAPDYYTRESIEVKSGSFSTNKKDHKRNNRLQNGKNYNNLKFKCEFEFYPNTMLKKEYTK